MTNNKLTTIAVYEKDKQKFKKMLIDSEFKLERDFFAAILKVIKYYKPELKGGK